MKKYDVSIFLDILVGIITAIITYFILETFKLSIALLVFSPLPLIAGFIRGKSSLKSKFIQTILMNLLFFVLLLAILNGVLHLIILFAIALIGTRFGIYLRIHYQEKRIKTLVFLFIYVISFIGVSLFLLPNWFDSTMWREVNHEAPSFTVSTIDGDTIQSTIYADKVIVIDFWATWCKPCKKQFHVLEKLYIENKANTSVKFLVINSLVGRDTNEKALEYINQCGFDLPFVHDVEGISYDRFEVKSLPRLFIIDKAGSVRYIHTGYRESENFYAEFNKRINLLLKES